VSHLQVDSSLQEMSSLFFPARPHLSFNFGLDIFCFEAFENRKSNHRALFHLILFQEGILEKRRPEFDWMCPPVDFAKQS
jgi:hypothetical protein